MGERQLERLWQKGHLHCAERGIEAFWSHLQRIDFTKPRVQERDGRFLPPASPLPRGTQDGLCMVLCDTKAALAEKGLLHARTSPC